MDSTITDVRLEAITKLVEKYFTLYSPLQKTTGYYNRYFNNELIIFDCLFYLNVFTLLNSFELDNVNGLRKTNVEYDFKKI